ncbi:MAG: cytochrome P450 [Paracoccaceae bacterium]|jgi:cytochrome P450
MTLIEGHRAIAPPVGVPVWDVDPYAPEVLANPAPFAEALRAKGPFAYIPRHSMLICGRYTETREVFGDWQRFTSARGVGLADFAAEAPWRPPSIVLEVDPPEHSRARKVILRAMSPKAVAGLKDDFRMAADALIDTLVGAGDIDVVTDLAEAFATTVFPAAVGLRATDARRLVDYGAMVFNALGPDNALRRASMARAPDIVPWITNACRRENLTQDGFGAAIYAAADDGEITEDEAGMLVRSLLSAGVDTTVTAIGSAIWCLATNPGEYARLRADPTLARPCLEEALRLTSPVHAFCRTAAVDTSVSGIAIPEGAKILCMLGSANLDPDQWPDPTRFDIGRRPAGHLAFGVGVHNCVGQSVARAEGDAILSALAAKVSGIEIIGDPVWRPNNAIHALDHMKVILTP